MNKQKLTELFLLRWDMKGTEGAVQELWDCAQDIARQNIRKQVVDKVETILFRRVLQRRLEGYTLETAIEIAEMLDQRDELAVRKEVTR